jgi:hypothetical protein
VPSPESKSNRFKSKEQPVSKNELARERSSKSQSTRYVLCRGNTVRTEVGGATLLGYLECELTRIRNWLGYGKFEMLLRFDVDDYDEDFFYFWHECFIPRRMQFAKNVTWCLSTDLMALSLFT